MSNYNLYSDNNYETICKNGKVLSPQELFNEVINLEQKLNEQIACNAKMKESFELLDQSIISMGADSVTNEVTPYLSALKIHKQSPTQSLNKLKSDVIRKAAAKTLTTGQPTRHANYALKIKEKFFDYANQLLKEGE